jgi:hypothetical protein
MNYIKRNAQTIARAALAATCVSCVLWYMDLAMQFQRVYWLLHK